MVRLLLTYLLNAMQTCPVNGSRRYPRAISLHRMNSREVLHFHGKTRCPRANPVHDLNLNLLTIGLDQWQ